MDSYEATRIVFSRVSKLDPENASKIMGLLLIQDHGEKEMIRLALGPENFLHSVILKARKDLGLMPISNSSIPGFFGHGGPDHVLEETATMDLLSSSPSNGSDFGLHHRRSDAEDPGFGWKPCLYYARGYCKNGAGCRFLHAPPLVGSPSKVEMIEQHEAAAALMRSKSVQQQRLAAALNSFPYSSKCMSFLLQQQTDAQRAAAAALMMGEDMHKFSRSPRMEQSEFAMMNGGGGMVNPASRQIYLTFPADSTFREEDVSNYFSIYGPVQDVRIPYQQKRMFGFVTFVYPETVKLILAKGNPHFVCDARVLVKPYKEKGKVHDKYKQQGERGDLSPCGTPTGLDGRDPYDLQLGARMFYNSQDMLWRRKLEEQAELQQALELQSQRLMGLQLLDVKKHHHRALSASSPINSPTQSPSMFSHSFMHPLFHGQEENCASPVMPHSAVPADQQHKELAAIAIGKESASNSEDSGSGKQSPHDDDDDDICGLLGNMEHILPDSPFASPTKGAQDYLSAFPALASAANDSSDASAATANINLAASLMPTASSPEMTSFKPFNCQLPRLSSGHGAIGMYAPGAPGPKCPVGTS